MFDWVRARVFFFLRAVEDKVDGGNCNTFATKAHTANQDVADGHLFSGCIL